MVSWKSEAARAGMRTLGDMLGQSEEGAAKALLSVAAEKAARTVRTLLTERNLSRETTELIGGGGGAGALVPTVGELMNLPTRIAPNNAVVSAIGTALALVRDVVERTVPEAKESDLLQIRREAVEAGGACGGRSGKCHRRSRVRCPNRGATGHGQRTGRIAGARSRAERSLGRGASSRRGEVSSRHGRSK